ncbi:hypothetical protein [Rivularia sp. UHCC 0363]|uniref:hypothetical protein n=1 Tax=Rivularia sp. UHCC 0363 TaxID=3110244 RepID=UPI002B218118|nr:hypothetical protein [Rivularia sp. UHCC 0363]MEA5599270.1 hypothetical protein [Rivularia sp. UHCC 0363]
MIASFFCLSFSLVLIISCAATPVLITGARIATNISAVIELIDASEKILSFTSNLVNRYYKDLGEDIRSENVVSDIDQITQRMEVRYAELSSQHKELDDSLEKTNKAADKLFSMLKERANQNSRAELKQKLLNDINVTEKEFTERIDVAENVSLKLKGSIKEYDNILNVFQVTGGLRKAREYLVTIDSVISQYENLNREVQIALDEGRQLIKNIADTPNQVDETLVFTPTDENTPQQTPSDLNPNPSDITNKPEDAIAQYYQLINQRQYSSSWAMLSSRFKSLQPDNNYNNYQEWWDKVASTRIDSIRLIETSDNNAVVDVKLKYSLKDGRELDDPSRITLTLDSNGKWLIDDKRKLED